MVQSVAVPDNAPARPVVYRSDPHPCSYLPNRLARSIYFFSYRMDGAQYETLLADGWRRSGQVFYKNDCPDCKLCLQMRIAIAAFQPTKGQRRSLRTNSDLQVSITEDLADPIAIDLYTRYQVEWHKAEQSPEAAEVRSFLAESAVPTTLMRYHLEDHLVGAGWVDILDQGLSSVYFAFDPNHARRRLGVFSLLMEIELGRRLGKTWLWLGFMVPGSVSMAYKRQYGPHELLIDGQWQSQPSDAIIADYVAANPGQASTS